VKAAAPEDAGFAAGRSLGGLGRAQRFDACHGRELWRFAPADEAAARRLLALGERGVGGFAVGGLDARGPWLVRAPLRPTLATWLKEKPVGEWRAAVRVAFSLATALAACEDESLSPGPIVPEAILLRDNLVAELVAEPLVGVLVGAVIACRSPSPRWMPPEQAAGAAWDAAANRYVLGLLLYRMLSGEHPFSGSGLRVALDAQARRGAPPFEPALASRLPPGLQALCLRLLDADASRRPASAALIVERLRALLAEERAPDALPVTYRKRAARPAEPAREAPKGRTRFAARAVLSLAAVVAPAAALSLYEPSAATRMEIGPRAALRAETTRADDCGSCHPAHAAEWHRSVMAHSVKSPLFLSLEMLVEEQIGRDDDCPGGAGILRASDGRTACRDARSGLPVTGSGGELWCVNCHAPGENLAPSLPAWDGRAQRSLSRRPLSDLLPAAALEGISCAFCHQVHGPARPGGALRGAYEGNPFWTSTATGERFTMRPEALRGLAGISNSGYALDPAELIAAAGDDAADLVAGGAHRRPTAAAKRHLASSQFCGGCHDVRLFGSDVLGVRRGDHFKRLRNGYSEWAAWAERESAAGRPAASCQGCHMSTFPGVCESGEPDANLPQAVARACPKGSHFSPRAPGTLALGRMATVSTEPQPLHAHYLTGVEVPLASAFAADLAEDSTTDTAGVPLGARQRRDLLVARSVRLELEPPRVTGARIEVPLVVENVGAGHRVPGGFSQERELWVHLRVTDARSRLVYEVGRVDRPDQDLGDKTFLRVSTDPRRVDERGRPVGLFGADVTDGPDVARWAPPPELGGRSFRGRGLVNFQNGFLRCVVCIGRIDSEGQCEPLLGQDGTRAERYAEGDYDPDTGACRSNLAGRAALFETYFPVGALDATRGVPKAPDAIIDTRSLPPNEPKRYVFEISAGGFRAPFTAEARLLFRAFPPYLLRAFAEYERAQQAAGLRPNGRVLDERVLERLEVVEVGKARASGS
jgi:hypothetical protein